MRPLKQKNKFDKFDTNKNKKKKNIFNPISADPHSSLSEHRQGPDVPLRLLGLLDPDRFVCLYVLQKGALNEPAQAKKGKIAVLLSFPSRNACTAQALQSFACLFVCAYCFRVFHYCYVILCQLYALLLCVMFC